MSGEVSNQPSNPKHSNNQPPVNQQPVTVTVARIPLRMALVREGDWCSLDTVQILMNDAWALAEVAAGSCGRSERRFILLFICLFIYFYLFIMIIISKNILLYIITITITIIIFIYLLLLFIIIILFVVVFHVWFCWFLVDVSDVFLNKWD